MIAYGIIDRKAALTGLGEQLFRLRNDTDEMYRVLGRHILQDLNGLNLVQCILDMQAAGESVTLESLRKRLADRNIHFPSGGKHPSIMRLWLERARVFESGWRISEDRLQELLGASTAEIDALTGLTSGQRAFLKALVNVGPGVAIPSNKLAELAERTYGANFNEKNLPKQVLYPLRDLGYIELERGTKTHGRGAKPFVVKPAAKLIADVIMPLLEQLDKQLSPGLRPLLRRSMSSVLQDLLSSDRHVRGLALEALAFKLMMLLGLTYVATRLRGEATGGAEVDVIFESSRLVFSRWQIQCKNVNKPVALDDVAKEVGLTHFLKSNVIVIVSTGEIGSEARRYANKVMADSNLSIAMVDRADIKRIESDPSMIIEVFNREAKSAMRLKVLEGVGSGT